MSETFVDTSFFVALLNRRDRHYVSARRFAAEHTGDLVTTAWVLSEVGNYFSRSVNRSLFLEMIDLIRLSRRIIVVPADEGSFDAGLDLFAARPDKNWSLVDCISFTVMSERGIVEALTADHHVEQAGFRVLLG